MYVSVPDAAWDDIMIVTLDAFEQVMWLTELLFEREREN